MKKIVFLALFFCASFGFADDVVSIQPSAYSTTGNAEKSQLSWEEQKRLDSERRKIEKEVARLEAKITELETKKSELENKMADPAVYSNGEKAKAVQREIEAVSKEIDETTAAWEEAAEKMC